MKRYLKNKKKGNVDCPVSGQFRVPRRAYDIYRSNKLIIALVVVESAFRRDLRMY
jgi:hypothetical protein